MCARVYVRAHACALETAHVSVYACACRPTLAGAGWRRDYMRVCGRVRIDV